jgi:hypothetical protein
LRVSDTALKGLQVRWSPGAGNDDIAVTITENWRSIRQLGLRDLVSFG